MKKLSEKTRRPIYQKYLYLDENIIEHRVSTITVCSFMFAIYRNITYILDHRSLHVDGTKHRQTFDTRWCCGWFWLIGHFEVRNH